MTPPDALPWCPDVDDEAVEWVGTTELLSQVCSISHSSLVGWPDPDAFSYAYSSLLLSQAFVEKGGCCWCAIFHTFLWLLLSQFVFVIVRIPEEDDDELDEEEEEEWETGFIVSFPLLPPPSFCNTGFRKKACKTVNALASLTFLKQSPLSSIRWCDRKDWERRPVNEGLRRPRDN